MGNSNCADDGVVRGGGRHWCPPCIQFGCGRRSARDCCLCLEHWRAFFYYAGSTLSASSARLRVREVRVLPSLSSLCFPFFSHARCRKYNTHVFLADSFVPHLSQEDNALLYSHARDPPRALYSTLHKCTRVTLTATTTDVRPETCAGE